MTLVTNGRLITRDSEGKATTNTVMWPKRARRS